MPIINPSTPATAVPAARSWTSVWPFALSFAALHTILWAFCVGLLLFYVPRAERTFRDFDMLLSAPAAAVVEIARWVANYWYVLVLWFPFGFAFDAGLLAVLSRRHRGLGWTWAVLNTVLPLLFIAFIVFAIEFVLWVLLDHLHNAPVYE